MERKNNRKVLLAAVGLALLAAAMLTVWLALRPGTTAGTKTVTVEVLHGDGTEKTFTYRTDEEYLGQVLLREGLAEGEQGEYGLYILSVDGERAVYEEDGSYWALFQNDEYATSGADTTPIADGDLFRLEYTR